MTGRGIRRICFFGHSDVNQPVTNNDDIEIRHSTSDGAYVTICTRTRSMTKSAGDTTADSQIQIFFTVTAELFKNSFLRRI